jgi:hypothetical protein
MKPTGPAGNSAAQSDSQPSRTGAKASQEQQWIDPMIGWVDGGFDRSASVSLSVFPRHIESDPYELQERRKADSDARALRRPRCRASRSFHRRARRTASRKTSNVTAPWGVSRPVDASRDNDVAIAGCVPAYIDTTRAAALHVRAKSAGSRIWSMAIGPVDGRISPRL